MAPPASRPDRRLMPRPLPAHLASAILLWLSSRAALTSWNSASPGLNAPGNPAGDRLPALAAEIRDLGPERVAAALDLELRRRAAAFLAGIEAYRNHPFRRARTRVPVRWRHGAARLLDYGRRVAGPAVLIVPSLINRHYILDLLRERSFVLTLASAGLRPLVLDWGEPGATERAFGLSEYIALPLEQALTAAATFAGGPVALLGYCMGGLLALALAVRRPAEIACLALLATPWDFHAERRDEAEFLGSLVEFLPLFCGASDPVPVPVIQTLFMALDPFLAERKFIGFAGLDMAGAAAKSFVALEDWINDGVPLARPVALECARSWYRDNDPVRGFWQVSGRPVRPEEVSAPTLVVLPSRDKSCRRARPSRSPPRFPTQLCCARPLAISG